MSEEEKEKIKKEIEEQDKNLEGKLEQPKASYETYNWDEMKKKLPVAKTTEDRKKDLNYGINSMNMEMAICLIKD